MPSDSILFVTPEYIKVLYYTCIMYRKGGRVHTFGKIKIKSAKSFFNTTTPPPNFYNITYKLLTHKCEVNLVDPL